MCTCHGMRCIYQIFHNVRGLLSNMAFPVPKESIIVFKILMVRENNIFPTTCLATFNEIIIIAK